MPSLGLITVLIILSAYFVISAGVFFFGALTADEYADDVGFWWFACAFHTSCFAFCTLMLDFYLEGFL